MTVALALALLHFVWQGLLLGLVAFVLHRSLRGAAASTRYLTNFALLLVAPVAVLVTLAGLVSSPGPVDPVAVVTPPLWADLVAGAWAVGVAVLSGRSVRDYVALLRLRATGLPLRSWHATLDRLHRRFGVRTRVALTESPRVVSPMVTGWLRPMILLPLGLASRMPAAWVESILAHELAHVRRHDVLLGIVQRSIEILLFFHPVVWWLGREIRRTREEACDDLVVDALRSPVDYARALTELAALASPPPALSMGVTEGQLMSRIRHIVHRSPRPLARPHRGRLLSAALPAVVLLGLGCLSQFDAGPEVADTDPPASLDAVDLEPSLAAEEPLIEEPSALGIAWLPDSITRYEAEIVAAAEAHGVDPQLVAIVVLVESRGNPTARSPIGARGLMQVMPTTAAQIAQTRGLSGHEESALDDPTYNLDLGTWFLARQLEAFGEGRAEVEAVSLAAAAYNGGPDRLRASLEGRAELSDESARYSNLVTNLWAERNAPTSSLLQ